MVRGGRGTGARARAVATAVALVGSCAMAVAAAPGAQAVGSGVAQTNVVSAVPSAATPNVTDGVVYAISQVGSQIIIGGSFTGVQNPKATTTLTRNRVLAFDSSTGTVASGFAPNLDGTVQAVTPGTAANTVFVGGAFNNVNGVKSKGVALLNTTTGQPVAGFKVPTLNGVVYSMALVGNRLYLAGTFTKANGAVHGGLLALNATTGAVDPFMSIQTAGHHNYNGSGANGAVGPRAIAVNPAGTRAMVIGNFKTADGLPRDQIAMIDLDGAQAQVDPNWATGQFTAACFNWAFDTYVTDVQWSPDGSYFVVTATGGSGTNSDGSRSLCDSASRWESTVQGSNVQPTWVDYTGQDSLWATAISGSVVYLSGHERWLNNDNGYDYAGAGAVPRPGIAALDPVSGVPMTWNPGRNPRGAGAYALFLNQSGLYVGSDTAYIGNRKFKRERIAYFPLKGGSAPASTATAQLPANVYLAGPVGAGTANPDDLAYRSVNGSTIGNETVVPNTGVTWGSTRGAFVVGNYVYFPTTGGTFDRATFNGTTVGTPQAVDPYDDPTWSNVQTGSGQTYQGAAPSYYSELGQITGQFYSAGRIYYTLSGQTSLYWRWFSPDSGIVAATEHSTPAPGLANVEGMTLSGSTIYYANATDGSLHSVGFANGTPTGTDTVVDAAHDWRARNLFLHS